MRALLLSSLSLALVTLFVSACPPGGGTGEGEGEGEAEVLDGGPGEGEGEEGEGDEGEGEGEGDAGEGEGEGEIQGEPYTTGTAEEGVVCGDTTCVDANASCCVGFGGSACGAPGTCGQAAVEAACDGAEDCDNDGTARECCFINFSTQCTEGDTCRAGDGKEICVTQADCADNETCCSDDTLGAFGIDGGVCLPAEDNCAGQFQQP